MKEKRRGLGRGLGALIPTSPEGTGARPVDVFFPAARPASETSIATLDPDTDEMSERSDVTSGGPDGVGSGAASELSPSAATQGDSDRSVNSEQASDRDGGTHSENASDGSVSRDGAGAGDAESSRESDGSGTEADTDSNRDATTVAGTSRGSDGSGTEADTDSNRDATTVDATTVADGTAARAESRATSAVGDPAGGIGTSVDAGQRVDDPSVAAAQREDIEDSGTGHSDTGHSDTGHSDTEDSDTEDSEGERPGTTLAATEHSTIEHSTTEHFTTEQSESGHPGAEQESHSDAVGEQDAPFSPNSPSDPVAVAPERALPATASSAELVPVPGASFAEIPVDLIRPNSRQPRTVFDEGELDELIGSIREIGILQPIVVRPAPDEGGAFELIMGERRWRAAQAAGLDEIPAIIRVTDDEDMLRDALLENLHRSALNPLEEAAAYRQLLDDFGCTHDELAARISRSRPQISNTLRLLRLPPLVQRRVAAGVLSAGHARALLSLSDGAAVERLAQKIVAEGLSVRATEELVALGDLEQRPKRATPRAGQRSEAVDQLAMRLSDRFETRVRVDLGKAKGRVTIEFASVEDLNRILDVMAPDDPGILRH